MGMIYINDVSNNSSQLAHLCFSNAVRGAAAALRRGEGLPAHFYFHPHG